MGLIRPVKGNIIIKFCDKFIKNGKDFKMQTVNDSCFRSSQAGVDEFALISQKGVKTILNLKTISKKEAETLAKAAEKYGINYINLQFNPFNIKKSLPYIIDTIKNSSKENPMLVHCTFGKDRTGFVTALNRVIKEGLPVKEAVNDMHGHNFNKLLFFHMESFLKRFAGKENLSTPVTIPPSQTVPISSAKQLIA